MREPFNGRRRLYALLLPLLFVIGCMAGCATTPYTGRSQLMLFSEGEDAQIGEAYFTEIKAEEKMSADEKSRAMIERVGKRIAAAADKPDYKWEFVLIESEEVNAFALPGGKVAFYTGILPMTKDEEGVAVVMGHEVAHALARHGSERLSQQQLLSAGGTVLNVALAGRGPLATESVMQAYGLGAQLGIMLPFSRKHESEADKIGLILMAKAGYDPRGAIEFWKRMEEHSKGNKPPELLSTHPGGERRIQDIEEFMDIALQYYHQTIK